MPNYNSTRVNPLITARDGIGVIHQVTEFTVTTALINADTVSLFTVPEGSIILDLVISSNGTQSGSDSTFSLGDAAVPARYMPAASGTALRTGGGTVRMNAFTGFNFTNTADTNILLTVVAAGTGQATGGIIRAYVLYVPQA